jgi:hypothetical protein
MDIVNSDNGFLAETWPENEWNKLIDLIEGIYYEFANCLVIYSNCLNNPFQFKWKRVIDSEKFTFIEHGTQVVVIQLSLKHSQYGYYKGVNDSPSRILQCDKCKGEYFLSVV